jgi:hypothetical protein
LKEVLLAPPALPAKLQNVAADNFGESRVQVPHILRHMRQNPAGIAEVLHTANVDARLAEPIRLAEELGETEVSQIKPEFRN